MRIEQECPTSDADTFLTRLYVAADDYCKSQGRPLFACRPLVWRWVAAYREGTSFRRRPMSDLDVSLMRGTLDLLVLKALSWGPRHGYGVAEWIAQATGSALLVGEGTLYPALHRLERQGLVESEWGLSENKRTAKYYQLSTAGRRRLRAGASAWHEFVDAAGRALRATTPLPA